MDKEQFIFQVSEDVAIDVATISPADWKRIKADVKFLLQSKQCDDIGQAYISAFLVYIQDVSALAEKYDPDKHKFM